MKTVTKGVAVIIFRNDEVLLVKNGISSNHPTGVYGLPAGTLEEGESWEQAAVRECREESGLTPLKLIKLPTFYEADLPRSDGSFKSFCAWTYYCPEYTGQLKGSDEAEPEWVKIENIGKYHLVINVDKMIAEAVRWTRGELNP